jgi:hypothetical protein
MLHRAFDFKRFFGILVEKPEGKRPLERLRSRWNIKTDLKETGSEGVDWIRLAENRNWCKDFVHTVMNLRVP